MNKPRQPEDPPAEGAPVTHNPDGRSPNGIPAGIDDETAAASPNDDRQKNETAAG